MSDTNDSVRADAPKSALPSLPDPIRLERASDPPCVTGEPETRHNEQMEHIDTPSAAPMSSGTECSDATLPSGEGINSKNTLQSFAIPLGSSIATAWDQPHTVDATAHPTVSKARRRAVRCDTATQVHPGAVRCSPRQQPLASDSSSGSFELDHSVLSTSLSMVPPCPMILDAFAVSLASPDTPRNETVAMAAPLVPMRSGRCWTVLGLCFVALVVSGITAASLCVGGSCPIFARHQPATSVTPASPETSLYARAVTEYINGISLAGRPIDLMDVNDTTFGTDEVPAEELALYWLAYMDLLVLWPNTTTNQFRLRQRFALLTLLLPYSDFEIDMSDTLVSIFNMDECTWEGISCLDTAFPDNGTVPSSVTAIAVDSRLAPTTSWNRLARLTADLGLLTSLTSLSLTRHMLHGTVPRTVGRWTLLQRLNWTENFLTGTLPSAVGNWSHIRRVALDHNDLTGSLPASTRQWAALEHLDVAANRLRGSLPNVTWLNLSLFHAAGNQLSGTLPVALSQWTNLEYINVQSNQLAGTIPTSLGHWSNLVEARFAANNFTGTLPDAMCDHPRLVEIEVDCAEVSCSCCSCR